jgi:hypothetical protein
MAGNSAFEFASPGSYGDWATYAGFNRTTGEIDGMSSQAGVPPPQSMDQRIESAQNKLSAIVPAMQQLGQGNVSKAAGMMRNPSAPQAPTTPAPLPVDNSYDYTHGIETSGLGFPTFSMQTFG